MVLGMLGHLAIELQGRCVTRQNMTDIFMFVARLQQSCHGGVMIDDSPLFIVLVTSAVMGLAFAFVGHALL